MAVLYTKGDIDTAELENEEAVELPDLVVDHVS